MAFQTVFKRYELKYLLSPDQKEHVLQAMEPYMTPDQYGRTTIRNIYCDTDNYRLVRRSIERPAYKEKLRIRSYGQARPESPVFVELKRKYRSVVYKRRISLSEAQAVEWVLSGRACGVDGQIAREVEYFLKYYGTLRPAAFLSCEREAYYAEELPDFRITFDENVLCRQEDLSLGSEVYGTALLPEGKTLMEIKCTGGIPLWMTHVLSALHIYKTSFSKYGRAYQTMIYPRLMQEAVRYA